MLDCKITPSAIIFTVDLNDAKDQAFIEDYMSRVDSEPLNDVERDFLGAYEENGDFNMLTDIDYSVLGLVISDPYILSPDVSSQDLQEFKECADDDLEDSDTPSDGSYTCGELADYINKAKFYAYGDYMYTSFIEILAKKGKVSFDALKVN